MTDFEAFAVGEDTLIGNDGWLGSEAGGATHGILDDTIENEGKSAYLGSNPAENDVVSVWRPLDYDPIGTGNSIVTVNTLLGIHDSTNEQYDSFHISIFNREENRLAGFVLDNRIDTFGAWRSDGTDNFSDLDTGFEHDVVYDIEMRIDFDANRWSLDVDDIPLFADQVFTNTNHPLDLGDVSFEWELSDIDNPGDNWITFDNLRVEATGSGGGVEEALAVSEIRRTQRRIRITWPSVAGAEYQIEHSDDMIDWQQSLADSRVIADGNSTTFVDRTAGNTRRRYYRVRKTGG